MAGVPFQYRNLVKASGPEERARAEASVVEIVQAVGAYVEDAGEAFADCTVERDVLANIEMRAKAAKHKAVRDAEKAVRVDYVRRG